MYASERSSLEAVLALNANAAWEHKPRRCCADRRVPHHKRNDRLVRIFRYMPAASRLMHASERAKQAGDWLSRQYERSLEAQVAQVLR